MGRATVGIGRLQLWRRCRNGACFQRRAREATAARASMAARGEAAGAMARAATIGMAAATTAVTTAAAAGDSVAGDSPVALRCVDTCARGEEADKSGCST